MTELNEYASHLRMVNQNKRHDQLPKGVYLLDIDDDGFFLIKKDDFKLPKKLYGNHDIINRWKHSFEHNTEKNLGIILTGIKGSGKTITAQKFCIDMELPIILVTKPFRGVQFVNFITNPVLGKCIVFIDEYEKVYDITQEKSISNDLLSIMDGQYPTNLIFLLTVNDFTINEFLINRLNRLKYKKEYENLEDDVIAAVIDDMLIYPEHKDSIYEFFDILNMVTFDLLVNVIKEVNLFNESALVCGKHLNLKIEPGFYKVEEVLDGEKEFLCYKSINFNDNSDDITIQRYKNELWNDKNLSVSSYIEFEVDDDNVEIEKIGTKSKLVTIKDNFVKEFIPMGETPPVQHGNGYKYLIMNEVTKKEEHKSIDIFNGQKGYWGGNKRIDYKLLFTRDKPVKKSSF